MHRAEARRQQVVLTGVRTWYCALPLVHVIETMRALPLRKVMGLPEFVRGLCLLRGTLWPVLDLAALLGQERNGTSGGRFVAVRVEEERRLLLHVDTVIGIYELDSSVLQAAPSLVSQALPAQVEKLGVLDGKVLAVFSDTRLLSEPMWQALDQERGKPATEILLDGSLKKGGAA